MSSSSVWKMSSWHYQLVEKVSTCIGLSISSRAEVEFPRVICLIDCDQIAIQFSCAVFEF